MKKIRSGLFCLPHDLFKMDLDPISFMIYAYLISIKEIDDKVFPSSSIISHELNIPEATVNSRLQSLEEKAYVHSIHNLDILGEKATHKNTTYYIAYDFEKPWCRKIFSHKSTKN